MSQDGTQLFVAIAIEKGLLNQEQVAECREAINHAAEVGVKVGLSKVAQDRGFLSPEQIKDIRREMTRRGAPVEVGKYRILAKLGQGGMGAVYKAEDTRLKRVVALKVLPRERAADPDFVARFQREARLAGKIQHPNAVAIYETGEAAGLLFIAMEFIEGESLAERIRAHGPLPEPEALDVARQAAEALGAAHRVKIIHRDVKPANIMITRSGLVKVADLGIAKAVGEEATHLTRTGAAIGTPEYMSPEQCRSAKDVDERTDVYSLGATLFHILTGKPPYQGDTAYAIMRQHNDAPVPSVQSINPAVSAATNDLAWRMMAKTASSRPQTMEAVLTFIRQIEKGGDTTAPAVSVATDGFGAATADFLAPAQPGESGRQIVLRTRAIERRLAAVREFSSVWQRLGNLIDGARKTEGDLSVEAGDFRDLKRHVAERYQHVLPMLVHANKGGVLIEHCRADTPLATFRAMTPDQFGAVVAQWQAASKLLADFEQFLVAARRDLLRQHWFRYYWAKYVETRAAKVAVAVAILLVVVAGVAAFLVHRQDFTSGGTTTAARPQPLPAPVPAPDSAPAEQDDVAGAESTSPAAATAAVAATSAVPTAWPFDAAEANRRQKEAEATIDLPKGWAKETRRVTVATPEGDKPLDITYYKNTIGMEFVLVPAGEFVMGCPAGEAGPCEYEAPQHKVEITKPFLLGVTEVTHAQWRVVLAGDASLMPGASNPVERVSWNDCQQFLDKLRAKEGATPKTYRLPTEAEWEYACRAGTTTRFYSGDAESSLDGIAWYGNNSGDRTHPVGGKRPNAWGLYDTYGNVWEWCGDWCGSYGGDAMNPSGPRSGTKRVGRGGSWNEGAGICNSAYRGASTPDSRYMRLGLRLAADIPELPLPVARGAVTPEERAQEECSDKSASAEPARPLRKGDSFGGRGEMGIFSPQTDAREIIILNTDEHQDGFHFRRFVVPANITVHVTGHHPARIYATDSIVIDGVVEVIAQNAPHANGARSGGRAPEGTCGGFGGGDCYRDGSGPGKGHAGAPASTRDVYHTGGGGGGGGYGLPGGPGGKADGAGGAGGVAYGEDAYPQLLGGSGGGGGQESRRARSTPGIGGAGGGVLLLSCSGLLSVNGRLAANGGNGGNASGLASGGGGGSGGLIVLQTKSTLTIGRKARIEVLGGNAGRAILRGGANGGLGGKGRIIIICSTSGSSQMHGWLAGRVTYVKSVRP